MAKKRTRKKSPPLADAWRTAHIPSTVHAAAGDAARFLRAASPFHAPLCARAWKKDRITPFNRKTAHESRSGRQPKPQPPHSVPPLRDCPQKQKSHAHVSGSPLSLNSVRIISYRFASVKQIVIFGVLTAGKFGAFCVDSAKGSPYNISQC